MELNTASWVSLNLEWINNREWEPVFMELLAEPGSSSNDLAIPALSLHTIGARLLNVNDHVGCVELVDIEVEELIDELGHRFRVVLFGHVELLNHLQVLLEECVCFIHAIHLLIDVFRRIIVPSSLRVKLLNTDGVVNSVLSLVSQKSFL